MGLGSSNRSSIFPKSNSRVRKLIEIFHLFVTPHQMGDTHVKRQDIRLRVLARQGDARAQLKIGEAYLTGAEGIPQSISVGLDYLRAASVRLPLEAASCIARQLHLTDILKHGQLDVLTRAAAHDDEARLKLVALPIIRGDGSLGGYRWGLPLKQSLLERGRAA